jgi:hypothetical protein
METSQAVVLPPLQSPLHSRPEEPDRSLPRLGALAYQPIDSENGDIRLIEVLPGHYNDAIQMNLHTNNLGDKPNYEALSYAWGTTPSSNRAIINGYPVPVRESLDLGLRRLRLTDEPRTLWVDALCINQNDVRERSHQVQQMCRIYKSAKQVVIWLGEWPDLDTCPHPERCQSMLMEWLDGRSALSLWARSCLQPPGHVCQHAVEIVKLPWFRRLWIIQEFALASSKTMILGDRVTNSKDFFSAIRNCIQISIDYSSLSASDHKQQGQLIKHFDMFMEIEGNVLKNEAITLYEAWLLSQYFMATDPRDKIYGLLGIVKFHVTQPMIPDYSKAWPQVLAEATMVMISEEGLFPYMIRGFVFPSTEQPKEGYRMPSWVLDLSQRIRSDVIENVEDYSKYSGHKLDSEGTERRRRSLRLSEDFRTLYKHGWHVGTIKRICVFTFDLAMEGYWEHRRELGAGLHDFYHQVLKPKGVAPNHLYEAIKSRLDPYRTIEIDSRL